MSDTTTLRLVRAFVEKKEHHHHAAGEADKAKKDFQAAEWLLQQHLEDTQQKSGKFDLPGIGTVTVTSRKPTIYGKIEDMELAQQAFEQSGRVDELIAPEVRKKRLNEYVRECLENGVDLPEGVSFYERGGITLTRS